MRNKSLRGRRKRKKDRMGTTFGEGDEKREDLNRRRPGWRRTGKRSRSGRYNLSPEQATRKEKKEEELFASYH
jgi:hypothetical protein